MIFKKKKHHQHITQSQSFGLSDISASTFSENLKPLTNTMAPDRIKKFSYIDCIGYISAREKKLLFLTGDEQFKEIPGVEFVK